MPHAEGAEDAEKRMRVVSSASSRFSASLRVKCRFET
jgi:hypothetical protein